MTPPGLFDGKRRALFIGLVGFSVVQAVAFAAAAIATRAAFGAFHAGTALPVLAITTLGIAGVVSALMQFAFRTLGETLGQDYARDVRLALFDHASRSDQSDLDQRRMGYHLLRFTGDLTALIAWPGVGLPRLIQAAILFPAALGVLAYLNPIFGWVGLAAVLPTVLGLAIWHRALLRRHKDLRKKRALLAADITERLPVAPQLAAFGRRQIERRRIGRKASDLAGAAQDRRRLSEALKAIPDLSAALAGCAILTLGSLHSLPAATVAAALAALALTVMPLRNVVSSGNRAAAFQAAHAKLSMALMRPLAPHSDRETRLKRHPLTLDIEFEGKPPLHVPAGGQATLSREQMDQLVPVLTGVTLCDAMAVQLDGRDIRTLTPGSLRRCVGVLTDAPLLLKGSLRRAITLGLTQNPSDADIQKILAAAGLADAIHILGGFEQRIAERGANLTAEHRALISILRVCLQKPGLILVQQGAQAHAAWLSSLPATKLVQASPSDQDADKDDGQTTRNQRNAQNNMKV